MGCLDRVNGWCLLEGCLGGVSEYFLWIGSLNAGCLARVYGVPGISLCSGWGLRVQTLDGGDSGGK